MPHQCTGCGHAFADGSKEMLSGCPSCGGKKFQFIPSGSERTADTIPASTSTVDPPSDPPTEPTDDVGRVERAASAVRGLVSDDSTSEQPTDPETNSTSTGAGDSGTDAEIVASSDTVAGSREDSAQAAARSTVVSREELPKSSRESPALDEPEEPDLETLRRELNEQFESIKILEPGQYELNLMELFDREERIIAIEEDGRYVIDVPDGWREREEE